MILLLSLSCYAVNHLFVTKKQMNQKTSNCLQIKPINYHSDLSLELFNKVASKPWAMLLRSASREHVDSRFDILVAAPLVKIITSGQTTQNSSPRGSIRTDQDPFQLLEQQQDQWLPKLDYQGELPFIGGALGYFLRSWPQCRAYHKSPNKIWKHQIWPLGIYSWAVILDHQTKTAFVVGENVDEHYGWLISQDPRLDQDFVLTSEWQSNMTKQSYVQRFSRVKTTYTLEIAIKLT